MLKNRIQSPASHLNSAEKSSCRESSWQDIHRAQRVSSTICGALQHLGTFQGCWEGGRDDLLFLVAWSKRSPK